MQTDATTAETWLRNAPASERSVTRDDGLTWEWRCDHGGYFVVPGETQKHGAPSSLARGTYTLNYREGMQLDAQEAWDYLAGGEGRRCRDKDGHLVRAVGSHAQLKMSADDTWDSYGLSGFRALGSGAPYTIAPDEPAGSMWTTPANSEPIPEAAIDHSATEAALADLPPNPQRDSWVRGEMGLGLDAREAEERAALAEPDCCREARERHNAETLCWRRRVSRQRRELNSLNRHLREARERVAELEGVIKLHVDALGGDRRTIADLEAKLAEAKKDNAKLRCRLAGLNSSRVDRLEYRIACLRRSREVVSGQRDAAVADRDKLRAEVRAWRDAFYDQLWEEGDGAGEDAVSWPPLVTERVAKLRAEVDLLKDTTRVGELERAVEIHTAERVRMQGELVALSESEQGLRAEVERLTASLSAATEHSRDLLRDTSLDRETLGMEVRKVWVRWAKEQPNPKPSWLVPWCDLGEVDREVDRRIGEHIAAIVLSQCHAITLPTDTTTPLDLAQRAVALMGGRRVKAGWFHYRIPPHSSCGQLERAAMKGDLFSDTWEDASWASVMATQRRVTLAPEPEPARRRLSFGEAVEALGLDHDLAFRATVDDRQLLLRWAAGGIFVTAEAGVVIGITPAMLAAEWEAAS